jgi:hypothetical protein
MLTAASEEQQLILDQAWQVESWITMLEEYWLAQTQP